jgi:hypothetical protein
MRQRTIHDFAAIYDDVRDGAERFQTMVLACKFGPVSRRGQQVSRGRSTQFRRLDPTGPFGCPLVVNDTQRFKEIVAWCFPMNQIFRADKSAKHCGALSPLVAMAPAGRHSHVKSCCTVRTREFVTNTTLPPRSRWLCIRVNRCLETAWNTVVHAAKHKSDAYA